MGGKISDISKLNSDFKIDKKEAPKIDIFEPERSIMVPMLNSEKIKNPKYISYNQIIRQKIKRQAYYYVDHPDFKKGEVYLTFVVASDGRLKDIKVIEENTSANDYLRNVGLRSVRSSSPFPPFPEDLNFPELTFNVVISFQMKD